eukprot:288732_1
MGCANCKPKRDRVRMLILGLDGSGKTSLLYWIKLGKLIPTVSTIGYNIETIRMKGAEFNLWDVGGQDKLRDLWRHYYPGCNAIIFMIDSNDRSRIDLAKKELHQLLEDEELNDNAILLVLANKQDLPNAMSVQEVTDKLSLNTIKNRTWYIHPSCATTGDGLYEGLDWISNTLNKLKIKSRYGYSILIVGLDSAGKTTLLYKLKLGETVTTIPTIGFNVETVRYSMRKPSTKPTKHTIGLSMG